MFLITCQVVYTSKQNIYFKSTSISSTHFRNQQKACNFVRFLHTESNFEVNTLTNVKKNLFLLYFLMRCERSRIFLHQVRVISIIIYTYVNIGIYMYKSNVLTALLLSHSRKFRVSCGCTTQNITQDDCIINYTFCVCV